MHIPKLPNLRVVGVIGEGAGSLVYQAEHLKTGEKIAIKHVSEATVNLRSTGSTEILSRKGKKPNYNVFYQQMTNEWEMLSQIEKVCNHPGLIIVYDLIPIRKTFAIVGYDLTMEYVEGVSLREKRDYPIEEMIRIYRESASCLGAVHAAGVIHADIKPHHIFVAKGGGIKILDFGQARYANDAGGKVQGTPQYMAPEQFKGKPVDARTDVYLLGATMFLALTGQHVHPVAEGMPTATGFSIDFRSRRKSLREFVPTVPEQLEEIILSSCEIHPEDRPRSMTEVMRALDGVK